MSDTNFDGESLVFLVVAPQGRIAGLELSGPAKTPSEYRAELAESAPASG